VTTVPCIVRASGRVGQLLLFGRFFVVSGVFEIVYTRYFLNYLSSIVIWITALPLIERFRR